MCLGDRAQTELALAAAAQAVDHGLDEGADELSGRCSVGFYQGAYCDSEHKCCDAGTECSGSTEGYVANEQALLNELKAKVDALAAVILKTIKA